ncbi:MAG: hypothetical protein MGG11_10760 [Trichodesmium sp. MAG_R03]|nr:hypothetical protein [Trichodesmium sp. MAG_R03]
MRRIILKVKISKSTVRETLVDHIREIPPIPDQELLKPFFAMGGDVGENDRKIMLDRKKVFLNTQDLHSNALYGIHSAFRCYEVHSHEQDARTT